MNLVKTNKGVSLLELMLVLAIAAVILMASMQQYANYRRAENVATLEQSVGMLLQALNKYYYLNHNCLNPTVLSQVTTKDLVDAGLLYGQVNNPWGSLSVAIRSANTQTGATTPPYYLQVSAVINDANDPKQTPAILQYVQRALNADPGVAQNNTITWTRLPSYSLNDLSSHQWVIQKNLATFLLPGRGLTSINEGTDSGLWIAQGGLRTFDAYENQQPAVNGAQQSCPD